MVSRLNLFFFSVEFSYASLYSSFEPEAEKTCEELLTTALQTAPGHPEALQALASVRMSQQRPEEAKQCLEQAWTAWKDLDLGGHAKFLLLSYFHLIYLKMIQTCHQYLPDWCL